MIALMLAATILSSAAPGAAPSGADDIRIDFAPRNLFPRSQRLAGEDGPKILLTYGFLRDGEIRQDYRSCPDLTLWREGSPGLTCGQAQEMIVFAAQLWAEASGRLVLRPAAAGQRADIRFGFAQMGDVGRMLRNSQTPEEDTRLFGEPAGTNPRYPDKTLDSAVVLFNSNVCWYGRDAAICPPRVKNGSVGEPAGSEPVKKPRASSAPREIIVGGPMRRGGENHSLISVAAHEFGHVMGFGHHSLSDSLMQNGGAAFDSPQPVDIRLVRDLWGAAAAPRR